MWSHKPVRDNRDVERVKDATDIVRLVGEAVSLKPKGREFVGLCPFHDDHNPSMYVVPGKQIYHCFVCGAAGDVLTFVQKFHKMEFREALEFLATRAGIVLTPIRASAAPSTGPSRRDLVAANEEALRFFQLILKDPEHGREARTVLERRGISPEMVERFQIGAAPDRWDGLVLRGRQKGIPEETLLAAGLLKRREGGSGTYDVLRHRLIFPIHNKAGQPIAFGGRKLRDEDEPKYLNSPETPLFDKSSTLYALHHATPTIQRLRTAIVCEGYTDVIACHQAGFTNAVATLGTALTAGHARELRLRCDTVVLLFDGDDAGQRAADRAVPIFFGEPLDVRIATLAGATDAKDPDELLRRPDGASVFAAILAKARGLLEYRFARLRARLKDAGPAAVEKAIVEEVSQLASMGLASATPVRRALVEKSLAELSGLDLATIRRIIPAGRAPSPVAASSGTTTPAPLPHAMPLATRESLLGCVLCDGALWGVLLPEDRADLTRAAYPWPVLDRLAGVVQEIASSGTVPSIRALSLEDPEVHAAGVVLMSRVDEQTDRGGRLRAFFEDCVRQLRLERANVEIKGLSTQVAMLKKMQDSHRDLGPNRRVLPRPG